MPLKIERKLILVILFVSIVCATILPSYSSISPKFGNQEYYYLVGFKNNRLLKTMLEDIRHAGGEIVQSMPDIGLIGVKTSSPRFAMTMRGNPNVEFVSEDTPKQYLPPPDKFEVEEDPSISSASAFVPDPLYYMYQWDFPRVAVTPETWDLTTGVPTVKVAILDTGVNYSHPEIAPNYDFRYSTSFIPASYHGIPLDGPYDMMDYYGHGTWCAGCVAAAVNGFASNGIAPHVMITNVKVLCLYGFGLDMWIISGIYYAVNVAGVNIISMSLGGYLDLTVPGGWGLYQSWLRVTHYAREKGVLIVAAAGNELVHINAQGIVETHGSLSAPPDDPYYWGIDDYYGMLEIPAGLPEVVMVSATNNIVAPGKPEPPFPFGVGEINQLSYYSNYGEKADLAAPGGARKYNLPRWDGGGTLVGYGCFGCWGPDFDWVQGTSMATPHVAGIAALVLSYKPYYIRRPNELLALLKDTATKGLVNYTPGIDPLDPNCSHLGGPPIPSEWAYGAGLINAYAALME